MSQIDLHHKLCGATTFIFHRREVKIHLYFMCVANISSKLIYCLQGYNKLISAKKQILNQVYPNKFYVVCINWGEFEALHKLIRKLSWLFANYLKHKNNWRNSNKSTYRTKKQPIGFRILKTKSSYTAGFSPGPK